MMQRPIGSGGARLLISIITGVITLWSCNPVYISTLEGRPCDSDGECIENMVCNPVNQLCGPKVEWGCEGNSYCPESVRAGDQCPGAGAYIPCTNDATECEDGCRTCGTDEVWSSCTDPLCTFGELESCGSCSQDCQEDVQNSAARCGEIPTPEGEDESDEIRYDCYYEGPCYYGYVDLDEDVSNGCECEIQPELCDGIDNDCDGVVDNEASDCNLYYADFDEDHWADEENSICECSPRDFYISTSSLGDCDDHDPLSYPGASEICDGNLNDCYGEKLNEEIDHDSDNYVECIQWSDEQGDNPEILGGSDCMPTDPLISATNSCTWEDGWDCTTENVCQKLLCGNSTLDDDEKCDLGELNGTNQGCTSDCEIQTGWRCYGSPLQCRLVCDEGSLTNPANTWAELPFAKAAVTGDNTAGASRINVADTTGFEIDDEILLITMTGVGGSCDSSNAGLWELKHITALGSTWFDLDIPLSRAFLTSSGEKHQVAQIRAFSEINIQGNSDPNNGAGFYGAGWNGSTGGIIIARADEVSFANQSYFFVHWWGGYRGGIINGAGPEGPLGRQSIGGGTGGAGGTNNSGAAGGAGQDGTNGAGGGGSGGGNPSVSAGGPRGGGGGGGVGSDDWGGCGRGAGNGGWGINLGGSARSPGAGGGGAPYATPPTCSDRSDANRLLMGSGAAAGASGGCAYQTGGTASGAVACTLGPGGTGNLNSGANGLGGGGIVILLANRVISNITTFGGLWASGFTGSAGGNGDSQIIDPAWHWEGLGGGGGGGGSNGASGGTIVLVAESLTGSLPIAPWGGAGGAGGAGGYGTCGGDSVSIVAGGATGLTGTNGYDASDGRYCGGGGGGGATGSAGTTGVVYISGVNTGVAAHILDAPATQNFGKSCE